MKVNDVEDILKEIPINGNLVIKVDLGQVKENLGLSRDSELIIPQEKAFASASSLGTVVKKASDAFGKKYQEQYGTDGEYPNVGDLVRFVPYQNSMLDKIGEYYLITDDGVKSIRRAK